MSDQKPIDNEHMICPYCAGSGQIKQRCVYCLGSGIRCMEPKIYCDCKLGCDLKRVEERAQAENKRKLDPEYIGGEW